MTISRRNLIIGGIAAAAGTGLWVEETSPKWNKLSDADKLTQLITQVELGAQPTSDFLTLHPDLKDIINQSVITDIPEVVQNPLAGSPPRVTVMDAAILKTPISELPKTIEILNANNAGFSANSLGYIETRGQEFAKEVVQEGIAEVFKSDHTELELKLAQLVETVKNAIEKGVEPPVPANEKSHGWFL